MERVINAGVDGNLYALIHQQCRPTFLHLHIWLPCIFHFMNVDVSNRSRPRILPMPPDFDRDDWIGRFSEVIDASWSRRMSLVGERPAPPGLRARREPPTVVTVHLGIRDILGAGISIPPQQNHNLIGVYRDRQHPRRKLFRSFQHGVPIPLFQPDGTLPTSDRPERSMLLHIDDIESPSNEDNESRNAPAGGLSQIVAVHEVGHALGLDHSNHSHADCQFPRDGNARICYGEPGSPEERSVMGRGMQIGPREYEPFVEIMRGADPSRDWRADQTISAPSNWCQPTQGRERARIVD